MRTLISFDSLRLESRKSAVGPAGRCMSSIPLICFRSSLKTATSVKPFAVAYFTIFFKAIPCAHTIHELLHPRFMSYYLSSACLHLSKQESETRLTYV